MPRASSKACSRPTSGSSASVSADANVVGTVLAVALLFRKPDALRPRAKFELAILSFSALVDAVVLIFVFTFVIPDVLSFGASGTEEIFGAV